MQKTLASATATLLCLLLRATPTSELSVPPLCALELMMPTIESDAETKPALP